MKADKALIPWQGIALLQRVVAAAQACCQEVVVLTPWPERYQTLVPKRVNLLQEPQAFAGPMAALRFGIETLQTAWILLLACDMPQLDATVLQQWIDGLPNTEKLAHVPYHQNRWEPLCGFYHINALPSLKAYLAAHGDRASFQKWLQTIDAVPLAVDAAIAPMFFNCNTPDDLTVN
jgi:molybdenum cofactor guanylyltransferase